LCLDYEHIGARSQEQCSKGYTYIPSSLQLSGLCVGTCRDGDTPEIRPLQVTHEGQLHHIDMPVCRVQTERTRALTSAQRSRALFGLSTFQLILFVVIGLWFYNSFVKSKD